ncbi:unnamed protein product [Mesocestoides corti]|uniref:Uncharacterized protein n=2 Tax=Mesocestoides corti TaxID=53468 RepID=A0A0R3U4C1_MESCO|nr:unnamed protein product [Mesocestoides corti]
MKPLNGRICCWGIKADGSGLADHHSTMKSFLLCLLLALVCLLAVNSATASMMRRHVLMKRMPDRESLGDDDGNKDYNDALYLVKRMPERKSMMDDDEVEDDDVPLYMMERMPERKSMMDDEDEADDADMDVMKRLPNGDEMEHTVGKSLHDGTNDYGNSSDVEDEEAAHANVEDDDRVEEE